MRSRPRTKRRRARGRGRPAGGSEPIVGAILDATLELLGLRGYAELRIEDVAARAGVNKTSVYRRWPAKSDLVTAALQALNEQGEPAPDTGSLRGDLVAMMRESRSSMASAAGAAVVRALMVADDPEVTEIARAIWDRFYVTPSPVFERAMARGELPRGTDTALLRELINAPLLHRMYILREPVDDAFLVRVADSVLMGIAPRKRATASGSKSRRGRSAKRNAPAAHPTGS
jgi:AcrR family transcriptional regulator